MTAYALPLRDYPEPTANDTVDCSAYNVRDDLKSLPMEKVKEIQHDNTREFAVMSLNTIGSLNTGTLIRTAVIFGAQDFYVIGRRRYDARATVGAQNYINLHRLDALQQNAAMDSTDFDVDKVKSIMSENRLYPIFVELTETSMALPMSQVADFWADIRDQAGSYTPCVVFGNEGKGIPTEILEAFPNAPVVHIEQFSVMRSLNVSVAAGIILHSLRSTWDEATDLLEPAYEMWSD